MLFSSNKCLWPEPEPRTFYEAFQDAIYIVAGLLALLAVYGFAMSLDAEARLADEQAAHKHQSALVVAAMNGGAIVDKQNATGYFFDKPMVVTFQGVEK